MTTVVERASERSTPTTSPPQTSPEELEVLTFSIDDQSYGLPITCIQEIRRIEQVTRLPETAAYVLGVINLRGRIAPVLDMRCLLDAEPEPDSMDVTIMVVHQERLFGLRVDGVSDVRRLLSSDLHSIDTLSLGQNVTQLTAGVASAEDGLVILLDTNALCSGFVPVEGAQAQAA
nr:purine-binding chemotaxis protein CheW [Oceanococcus sp. HetDA_MAG_MS8]